MSEKYYYEFRPTWTEFIYLPDPLENEPSEEDDRYIVSISNTYIKTPHIAFLQFQVNRLEAMLGESLTKWKNFENESELWDKVESYTTWWDYSLIVGQAYVPSLKKFIHIYDVLVEDLKKQCNSLLSHYSGLSISSIFHPQYRIKPPSILNYGDNWIGYGQDTNIYTRSIQQLRYFLEYIDCYAETWKNLEPLSPGASYLHQVGDCGGINNDGLNPHYWVKMDNFKNVKTNTWYYVWQESTVSTHHAGCPSIPTCARAETSFNVSEGKITMSVDVLARGCSTVPYPACAYANGLVNFKFDCKNIRILPDTILYFIGNVPKVKFRMRLGATYKSIYIDDFGSGNHNLFQLFADEHFEDYYNGNKSTSGVGLDYIEFIVGTSVSSCDGSTQEDSVSGEVGKIILLNHWYKDYYKNKTQFVYP